MFILISVWVMGIPGILPKDINHCNSRWVRWEFPISTFGCPTTSWHMKRWYIIYEGHVSNKSQELGDASCATHKMPLDTRYDLKGSRTIKCEILCKRNVEVKQYHTRSPTKTPQSCKMKTKGRCNQYLCLANQPLAPDTKKIRFR